MIIKNLNIINKEIQLTNIELDFSRTGVYLVQGKIGTGKSSIIKEIVYGEYSVILGSKDLEEEFYKNRAKFLAYVPQNLFAPSISVYEYIQRGNKTIDNKMMDHYLNQIEINGDDSFEKLSGGERIKIAVFSALLKNTPYIILDEPTNHLDNQSVKELINLIQNYQKEKTFIIITHDPRLQLDVNGIYEVSRTQINLEKKMEGSKLNMNEICNMKINTFQLFNHLINKLDTICILAILLSSFLSIMIINEYDLRGDYAQNKIEISDVICSYEIDHQIDEMNLKYANYQNIEIRSSDDPQLLTLDDLPKIFDLEDVTQIILCDQEYYDQLTNGEIDPLECIVSLPEDISEHFFGQNYYFTYLEYLQSGCLPHDNMNQIVLSSNLINCYYPELNNQEAIGKTIEFNGSEYEIVGISYYDFFVISYNWGENNYGFYEYNVDTYDQYCLKIKEYQEQTDYYLSNCAGNMLIYCKEGTEEKVLNYLIKNYPATMYNSDAFSNIFNKIHNKEVISDLIKYTIRIGLIQIIFLLLVIILDYKKEKERLEVYQEYYLSKQLITKIYMYTKLVPVSLFVIMFMLGIVILSAYPRIQLPIAAMLSVFTIISIVVLILIMDRINRKGLRSK